MSEKLYVIEQAIACEPKLTVYELIEDRKAVYIVNVRGSRRTLRKHFVNGRSYFTDQARAIASLREIYNRIHRTAERTALRMQRLLVRDDDFVLDYARGNEAANDAVWTGEEDPL